MEHQVAADLVVAVRQAVSPTESQNRLGRTKVFACCDAGAVW
jgi:hypothetical protein